MLNQEDWCLTAPLSPPQWATPVPAYTYGTSNHCPSPPDPPWGEDISQSNTATCGKLPADSNPGNNTGPARCGHTCVSQNSPYFSYVSFTSIKVQKTDERKECFSNNNQLESTKTNCYQLQSTTINFPESTHRIFVMSERWRRKIYNLTAVRYSILHVKDINLFEWLTVSG